MNSGCDCVWVEAAAGVGFTLAVSCWATDVVEHAIRAISKIIMCVARGITPPSGRSSHCTRHTVVLRFAMATKKLLQTKVFSHFCWEVKCVLPATEATSLSWPERLARQTCNYRTGRGH